MAAIDMRSSSPVPVFTHNNLLSMTSTAMSPTTQTYVKQTTLENYVHIYAQFLWFHLHGRIGLNTRFNLSVEHPAEYRFLLETEGFEFNVRFITSYHLSIDDVEPDNEYVCASSDNVWETVNPLMLVRAKQALYFQWTLLCNQLHLKRDLYQCLNPNTDVYGVSLWVQYCTVHGLCVIGEPRVNTTTELPFLADPLWCTPFYCLDTKRQVVMFLNPAFHL